VISAGWDSAADALTDLLSALRPSWSRGPRERISPTTRHRAARVLRELREHDRETTLLVWALEKADPETVETIRGCAGLHRLLRERARELCGRLRSGDVPGARAAARQMLGLHLSHAAGECALISAAVRGLSPAATACFVGRLWSRRECRKGDPPGFASDVYVYATRLMRHARHRARQSPASEVFHENPHRR